MSGTPRAAPGAAGGHGSRARAAGSGLAVRTAAAAVAVAGLLAAVPPAPGQEVITQQEALRLAFPGEAEVERRTAFLSEEEIVRAAELAGSGVDVEEPVVTHYVARRGDEALGVAYFDAHPVRTLTEVLMIVIDPESRVERVEVLRFDEPREYLPPEGWLGEFDGARLADGSARDVPSITGATLTARAVGRAVRRTLALHEVVAPLAGGDGDGRSRDGSAGGGPRGGGGR